MENKAGSGRVSICRLERGIEELPVLFRSLSAVSYTKLLLRL